MASSQGPGAAREAPPPEAAEESAALAGGVRREGRRGAACQGAAAAGCAGWRRSAPGAPWLGRTAAGFASVRRAGQLEGPEAFLLQERNSPSSAESAAPSLSAHSRSPTPVLITDPLEPPHTPTGNATGTNVCYIPLVS